MAVNKNVQQNRKAFVQAKLGQTGVEATPELRAKLRERFNTLSQTKEGRTKIAKALLPGGTAAERATLKKSIRPTQTGTGGSSTGGSTGTGSTGTGSTTVTYNPGIGGNPKTTVVTGSTTTKTPTGMGGNPITVTRTINNVDVPSNNSSSSAVIPSTTTSTTIPKTTTTTTVPKSTTSTTVPQNTTSTTVKQSNAFKSTGPSYTPSNETDLAVPIVGGILLGGAAVATKSFYSSESHIDRMTRVRQNAAARTAPEATGGTRSVLEGMRSFMSGGLRKGAK